ncbi:hypothetical protein HH310_12565 [Actinoplanes sp. TBRC 11911]|uniref:hypothetical protein n=1 Tax=Actinoplanes sp. TBRC 11911 TaxID=2729386 RepID=UPI00145E06A3|nr:hypothetical protein [Actinoplanes sp. TBRC 11911]NMO52026.1 hypothetical protein [Actinoplanes sp. TBRC 11911]
MAMATYDLGDAVPLEYLAYDGDGNLVDAAVALTVTAPDGTNPDVTLEHPSVGVYRALAPANQLEFWAGAWTVSGAVTDVKLVTWTVVARTTPAYTDAEKVKKALTGQSGAQPIDVRGDLIDDAIGAASRQIDNRCGRRFYADTGLVARIFPALDRFITTPDGAQSLHIDDLASPTGLIVETRTRFGSPWSPVTGFETGPDNAALDGRPSTEILAVAGWLSDATKVRVTGRWGWPSVPDEVSQACALQAARLYRRKDSPEGVLGNSEWGAVRVSRFDPDVESLIAPYILITA